MQLPTLRWSPLLGLILLLTLAAAFLRLWNFSDTLMFQGDQGRDALIVSQIFTEYDPVFIGPVTSVGNMYLGPFYYYFMLPFLFLSYPSPLGPAYAVAILGIVTIPLLYYFGRELVGKRAAVISTVIATFSVSAIVYSRFSWNPNPAAIVALVMMWATYRAWQRSSWYWVVVAVCFAILLQLHYIAALSGLAAGLIWLISLFDIYRQTATKRRVAIKQFLLATLAAILVVLVSLVPLMLFDFKHDGLIRKAFTGLFTQEKILDNKARTSLAAKVATVAKDSLGRAKQILFEHVIGRYDRLSTWLTLAFMVILGWQLKHISKTLRPGLIVILSYLLTGIVGTAAYQHSLFVHYFVYLFPAVFLTYGLVIASVSRTKGIWGLVVASLALLLILTLNVPKIPLGSQAWTITDVEITSEFVYEKLTSGEEYSLVLLSPSKDLYAQNYRYFLSTTDRPPLAPEEAYRATTLVIINEEHVTNVTDLPIYEIVTFPHKEKEEVYTIPNGPDIHIFRLE